MRIENSSISMEASREFKKTETSKTMIQFWQVQPQAEQGDELILSPEGMNLAENNPGHTYHPAAIYDANEIYDVDEIDDELDLYLSDEDQMKIRLLEELISWMTGKTFKFDMIGLRERHDRPERSNGVTNNPGGPKRTGPPMPSWGLRFHHSETRTESEKLSFTASGKVQSSDGREIEFDLNLHMERETYEHSSIDLSAGQALIDPIVIQTDSIPPGLADKKIQFDLDLDGALDEVSVPRNGSGFLVFDRNKNGEIDDGSELFGPQSGHGFSELRMLDSDGNGWLDENDIEFKNLQIWSMDASGEMVLTGLLEADVGAIYLGSVSTEYKLTDSDFEQNGQLRESGVYLKESGGVGSIHELDIRV